MLHSVYHSRDLAAAMLACDKDVFADLRVGGCFESSRMTRSVTFKVMAGDEACDFKVRTGPLCAAEFCITSSATFMRNIESEPIDDVLSQLLSAKLSFSNERRVVKFVLPARPPPGFSMQLDRAIEKYGGSESNLFVIVINALSSLEPRLLSRLVQRRCPSLESKTEDTDVTHLDAFLDRMTSRKDSPHKEFDEVHMNSYKLCGSLASVTDVALAIARRSGWDRDVVEKVAAIEALRYSTLRPSLLFDALLGVAGSL
jgi:hypothetical protein